jgi:hypothetical protein
MNTNLVFCSHYRVFLNGESIMPSATKKTDLIRKRKDKPVKANRKADMKRTQETVRVLRELSSQDKG